MADRFPLVANSSTNQIAEIPSGDQLNLSGNNIANAGIITATTFHGSGANLTSLPAGNLTGTVADARISSITASKLTGALPAISGANLTGIDSSKVKQTVYNSTAPPFYSNSSSFVQTNCNITITPTVSSSKIILQLSPAIWSASGQYLHLEVRASGGASGVIMSFGDFYTGYYGNTLLQGVHTGHNTTSAITYTIWARSDGGGFYCPNNNSDSDIDQRYTGIAWEVTA